MNTLLLLQGIHKHFFAIQAVKNVDLEIQTGQVISLVGENGAGKSTLAKIIAGVHTMDSGRFNWDGNPIDDKRHTVAQAQKMGISMIFQETNLVPHLNIAENIYLGREPLKYPYVIDRTNMHQSAKNELDRLGLSLDTYIPLNRLTQAYKQQVEIVKALSLNARLIIMDEPTSSLSIDETRTLLRIVNELKSQGISILYISHKLDEVMEISDRVVVMRDGRIVENKPVGEMTKDKMIKAMIGRDIQAYFSHEIKKVEGEIFRVENLYFKSLTEPVSFHLKKGEILGFAGLIGSGRTDLMQSIFGITPPQSGSIFLEGKHIHIQSPVDAIRYGIGYVPEDRREQGLILKMTVKDNIILPIIKSYSNIGCRNFSRENLATSNYIQKLQIKTGSIENRMTQLSGGNQQKCVLAKWLAISPKILILDEPTRGIDVGSKAEVHGLIMDLAQTGIGIILVSSEMEEMIGLSDRVLVMKKGKLAGELQKNQISEESIMQLAAHSTN